MKNYDIKIQSKNNDCIRYFSNENFYNKIEVYHSTEHIEIFNNKKYFGYNLHRLDGPAVECDSGINFWWYRGKWIKKVNSQEEFEIYIKYLPFV